MKCSVPRLHRGLLAVVLVSTVVACSRDEKPVHPPLVRDEALRQTLLSMHAEDQREMIAAMRGETIEFHGLQRIAMLKNIIAEQGWPGISRVGEDAANGAWIVAQHADGDFAFQQQCLALLEQAYQRGDAPAMNYAFLSDRVSAHLGQTQRFGTQGSPVYTDEQRAAVDAVRVKMGLGTMAEAAKARAKQYEDLMR